MITPATIFLWIVSLLVAGSVHLIFACRHTGGYFADDVSSRKKRLKYILFLGILMRLPFLFTEPVLSDDVWRNLWDGRVQVNGINPYSYSPQDEHLANLRDDVVWPRINHPQYRTIYPPFGQMAASVASVFSRLSGISELISWKLLVVAFEMAGMWLLGLELARRGAERWLVIWAWSPLAIAEFAGGGHIDGIALGLSGAAAALWMRDGPAGAGALFSAAVLTKVFPFPAAAGFVGRSGNASDRSKATRAGIAAMGIAIFLVIPYLSARHLMLETGGVYAENWEFNGVLNRWMGIDTWGSGLTTIANSVGMPTPWIGFEKGFGRLLAWTAVIVAGGVAARGGGNPFIVARNTLAAFLAIQPTVYPWYLANLLPWLCIAPSWSILAWLTLSPLTYEVVYTRALTGVWIENYLLQGIIFSIAATLFAVEYHRGRKLRA